MKLQICGGRIASAKYAWCRVTIILRMIGENYPTDGKPKNQPPTNQHFLFLSIKDIVMPLHPDRYFIKDHLSRENKHIISKIDKKREWIRHAWYNLLVQDTAEWKQTMLESPCFEIFYILLRRCPQLLYIRDRFKQEKWVSFCFVGERRLIIHFFLSL